MRAFRTLPLVALLLPGCSLFDSSGPRIVVDGTVVLVGDVREVGWPSDGIMIDSVATALDEPLTVVVHFGGGCAAHDIALLVERSFGESQPPVLRAHLTHNAHADPCDAWLARTIQFDLAIVRDHFRATYGSRAGAFALDVDDAPRVTHAFK